MKNELNDIPAISEWQAKIDTFWKAEHNHIYIFIDYYDEFPTAWASLILEVKENGYKNSPYATYKEGIYAAFGLFYDSYRDYIHDSTIDKWKESFLDLVPEHLADELRTYFINTAEIDNLFPTFIELSRRWNGTLLAIPPTSQGDTKEICISQKLLGCSDIDLSLLILGKLSVGWTFSTPQSFK